MFDIHYVKYDEPELPDYIHETLSISVKFYIKCAKTTCIYNFKNFPEVPRISVTKGRRRSGKRRGTWPPYFRFKKSAPMRFKYERPVRQVGGKNGKGRIGRNGSEKNGKRATGKNGSGKGQVEKRE
jgi:hypothetical protein